MTSVSPLYARGQGCSSPEPARLSLQVRHGQILGLASIYRAPIIQATIAIAAPPPPQSVSDTVGKGLITDRPFHQIDLPSLCLSGMAKEYVAIIYVLVFLRIMGMNSFT